jgi:hypothetical protein
MVQQHASRCHLLLHYHAYLEVHQCEDGHPQAAVVHEHVFVWDAKVLGGDDEASSGQRHTTQLHANKQQQQQQ